MKQVTMDYKVAKFMEWNMTSRKVTGFSSDEVIGFFKFT
jgi:hypothetical protein